MALRKQRIDWKRGLEHSSPKIGVESFILIIEHILV